MDALSVPCKKEYGGNIPDKPGHEVKPCKPDKHSGSKTSQQNNCGDDYRAAQRIVIKLRQESRYILKDASGVIDRREKKLEAGKKCRIAHESPKSVINKASIAK